MIAEMTAVEESFAALANGKATLSDVPAWATVLSVPPGNECAAHVQIVFNTFEDFAPRVAYVSEPAEVDELIARLLKHRMNAFPNDPGALQLVSHAARDARLVLIGNQVAGGMW